MQLVIAILVSISLLPNHKIEEYNNAHETWFNELDLFASYDGIKHIITSSHVYNQYPQIISRYIAEAHNVIKDYWVSNGQNYEGFLKSLHFIEKASEHKLFEGLYISQQTRSYLNAFSMVQISPYETYRVEDASRVFYSKKVLQGNVVQVLLENTAVLLVKLFSKILQLNDEITYAKNSLYIIDEHLKNFGGLDHYLDTIADILSNSGIIESMLEEIRAVDESEHNKLLGQINIDRQILYKNQRRLIIKDEQETLSESKDNRELSASTELMDNNRVFSETELQVLKNLARNGTVRNGTGSSLSLIIEKINEKALEISGDIWIEGNGDYNLIEDYVEDYRRYIL